eukprot:764938-Hanusia_phi.AAC.3
MKLDREEGEGEGEMDGNLSFSKEFEEQKQEQEQEQGQESGSKEEQEVMNKEEQEQGQEEQRRAGDISRTSFPSLRRPPHGGGGPVSQQPPAEDEQTSEETVTGPDARGVSWRLLPDLLDAGEPELKVSSCPAEESLPHVLLLRWSTMSSTSAPIPPTVSSADLLLGER